MSSSIRRAALIAPFALALAALTSFAQTTATAPGPSWGAAPGAPATDAGGLTIDFQGNQALVAFGRTGCPLAVVGQEVWDLQKLRKTGVKIPHNGTRESPCALSDDGSILVVCKDRYGSHRDEDPTADAVVWNSKTGGKICEIPSNQRDLDIDYVGLAADKFVLLAAKRMSSRSPMMEVWDAATGKLVRRFPCNFSDATTTTISPDGRYVAIGDSENVNVYDINTGERAATMPPPTGAPMGVGINMDGHSVRIRRIAMPYVSLGSLIFSPDGANLAAMTNFGERHFFSWDHDSKLIDNFMLRPLDSGGPVSGAALQWTPDKSAWLVNQNWLIDRKTHLPVWTLAAGFAEYPQCHFIDNNRLLVVRTSFHAGTEVVNVPWDDIHKASAAMADPKVQALLKPGASVSLEITCVKPRGEEAATVAMLTQGITKLLADNGIHVADNQPVVVSLRLEEGADAPRPIVTRANPFDFHTQATGRQASPAKGLLTVTVHPRGSDTKAYRFTLMERSDGGTGGTISDASLRDSMLRILCSELDRAPLPYFLARDDPSLMLPLGLEPSASVPDNFLKPSSDQEPMLEIHNNFSPRPMPQRLPSPGITPAKPSNGPQPL